MIVFFQISANTQNDTVTTYEEAEAKCHSQGSRLLQLRSFEQIWALTDTRSDYFGTAGQFLEHFPGSVVALGMKYGVIAGSSDPNFYYR